MKTKKHYRDIINNMKRVFDDYEVKREFLEDEFYLKLLDTATNDEKEKRKEESIVSNTVMSQKNITDIKMEIMINIDGIINGMKGTSIVNRFSFGLDIRKIPLTVFLTETKLLVRDKGFKKSDIIVFFDDTLFRTGNRGLAITKDEVISNINGIFKVIRFDEMYKRPEFHFGHKKDALRLYIDDAFYDLQVDKRVKYCDTALIILKLLYEYANTC